MSGRSETAKRSGGYTFFGADATIVSSSSSSERALASRSTIITKPFLALLVLVFLSLAFNLAIVFLGFHSHGDNNNNVHIMGALQDGKMVSSLSSSSSSTNKKLPKQKQQEVAIRPADAVERKEIQAKTSTILNAVIHIGPYKTGATAIQQHSQNLVQQLSQDNYEMPWSHLQHQLQTQHKKLVVKNGNNENVSVLPWWSKQMYFAACFFQNVPVNRSYQESDKLCVQDLLDAGAQIAKRDKKSLLVSAEQFSNVQEEGVQALHDYLAVNQFENVTIVAIYRRYYEWISAFHRDRYKDVNLYDAIASIDKNGGSSQQMQQYREHHLFPSLYHELQFNPSFQEELHHKYTLPTVSRFRKIFTTASSNKHTNNAVVVMNYHDQNKGMVEQFYCDIVPNANNTCESVKKEAKTDSSSVNDATSERVYEELAFGAHTRGLVKLASAKDAKNVVDAIEHYHGKTLNHTASNVGGEEEDDDDFPRRCLPKEMLDDIWRISVQAEEEFGIGGDNSANVISRMKDEFDKYSKRTFCEVDVDTVLTSREWLKFFQELRVHVPVEKDRPEDKPGKRRDSVGRVNHPARDKDEDLNYEVNDHSNQQTPTTFAVIHVGPYKTGTTAIQQYSADLVKELAKDNYEMPWAYLKKKLTLQRQQGIKTSISGIKVASWWFKQMYFALCFFQNVPTTRLRKEDVSECKQELLTSGYEIADQNKNSLLVSAEQFSNTEDEGVAALHQYTNRWNNVTIVAAYRRYFEWVVSFYNEKYRDLKFYDVVHANKTERLYPSIYQELRFNQGFRDEIKHKYTLSTVARFKQYFPNVVVLNYHDKSKRLVERFYCDVIPNAPNTCRKLKVMKVKKPVNTSLNRVYQELAYAAHRRGLINIQSKNDATVAESSIRRYQGEDLNHTSGEFPHRCLPKRILDEIWNITLQAEKEFGDIVDDSAIQTLKDDFDKYSNTRLCEVDLEAVLLSPRWAEFFKNLNKKLNHK